MPGISNDISNGGDQHGKYVELCALLTTGTLTAEELEDLDAHLVTCGNCRSSVSDFQQIVRETIPVLAAGREPEFQEDIHWSDRATKRKLLAAIEAQGREEDRIEDPPTKALPAGSRYFGLCLLLLLTGFIGYVIGTRHYSLPLTQLAPVVRPTPTQTAAESALTLRIAQLTTERDALNTKANEDMQTIDRLSAEVAEQARSLGRLKREVAEATETGKSLQSAELSALQHENASVRTDRDKLATQLKDTEASLASLNQELARLRTERVTDLMQTASMQKTIDELTSQLNSRESTLAEQQKFLASDRDIRELMGARDLLIADVSDVDSDGKSTGPFGRVFYTKNKSLIFYAFDLEKHPSLRNAKTFQVWGQKSSDKEQPANLGVFFMDNEANRRWVLKFDNPKVMEQVNAVFVTVEPKGGSEKPHGKQLMYAYLRTTPNHP